MFGVFNGPSARPDLRRPSFPRAAELPSPVERMREGRGGGEGFWLYEHFARLSPYASDARFAPTAFPVTSAPHSRSYLAPDYAEELAVYPATSRKGGERERHDAPPRSGSRLNVASRAYIYIGNNICHRHGASFSAVSLLEARVRRGFET